MHAGQCRPGRADGRLGHEGKVHAVCGCKEPGASRLDGFSAAASYYGGGIGQFASEHPRCPTLCHFGEKDHAIPLQEVEAVRRENPDVQVFMYPAGHGFNCEARGSFDANAAALARRRTLEFFGKHLR